MMYYVKAKNNLVALLGDNANGAFQVVGYKRQETSAERVTGNNRTVQVYTKQLSLDDSVPTMGPYKYGVSARLDISASSPAKADLATIKNGSSTPQEVATALSNIEYAAMLAREQVDECIELVFNIVLDRQNSSFGSDDSSEVDKRLVEKIVFSDPIDAGSIVVITASMFLDFDVDEEVPGIEPVEATEPTVTLTNEPWDMTGLEKEPVNETYVERDN